MRGFGQGLIWRFLGALYLVSFVCSCVQVPITGRAQLTLIPAPSLEAMGGESYREFLSTHKVSKNREQTQLVRRTGRKIQEAVADYVRQGGMAGAPSRSEWEFNLIENDSANAWALPGGKVAVYTGMMDVAGDESALAVVLAHEIAHLVANHANERLSRELLVRFGTTALGEALTKYPVRTQRLLLTAAGLGTEVGLALPFNRLQESEADRLGLIFMAMAGYDPRTALDFWERMSVVKKEQGGPPEFLSTHPSGPRRMKQIEARISEAMNYYRAPE